MTFSSGLPKIAICGHGRSGKDTAGRWLAENTPLRLGLTTSQVIAPVIAAEDGVSVEVAFARRHQERERWFRRGNELRRNDPAYLVRGCLAGGEIAVGLRNADEIEAARAEGLIDLFVWVERDVPRDPTQTFDASLCDVVILNNGTLAEFHERLRALARFAKLLNCAPARRLSA